MERTEDIGLVMFDTSAAEVTFGECEAALSQDPGMASQGCHGSNTSVDKPPGEGVAAEPDEDEPCEGGDKNTPEEVHQDPAVDVPDKKPGEGEAAAATKSPKISKNSDPVQQPVPGGPPAKVSVST